MRRTVLLALLFALAGGAAAPPRRIVSISPNVTEMLYGIGAMGQVAGITDYCTYPPNVNKLPSVGGWHDPDLEKIAALRPDLVIVDSAQAPFVQDNFKRLGLRLMVVPNHSVQDIFDAIAELGRATGHEAEAAKLMAETRGALDRIRQRAAPLAKPKVIIIVDRTPGTLRELYAATDGGFMGELLAIAGGRSGVPPSKDGYGRLSKEDLLAANPDVILDFIHGAASRFAGDPIAAWKEMGMLKAVRTRQVHGVNEDYVPHASQRIVLTAALFARLIHPGWQ